VPRRLTFRPNDVRPGCPAFGADFGQHSSFITSVDAAYGQKSFANDAARVAFLFELYR
jgi:hypothetical protein